MSDLERFKYILMQKHSELLNKNSWTRPKYQQFFEVSWVIQTQIKMRTI